MTPARRRADQSPPDQSPPDDRPASPTSSGTALPKLTLGQRILTVLPQLGKSQEPAAGANAGRVDVASEAEGAEPDTSQGTSEAERGTPPAAAAPVDRSRLRDRLTQPDTTTTASARKRPYKDVASTELAHRIKFLDDSERKYVLVAAPLGVVLALLLTFNTLRTNPPLHHKDHQDPTVLLLYGLTSILFAACAIFAALRRRRSLAAFSLLLLGFVGQIYTAIPMWALAIWLFVRSNRYQRELTVRGEGPRARSAQRRQQRGETQRAARPGGGSAAASRASGSGSVRRAAARGAAAADARAARRRKQPVPAGPAASKRYTPPKPPRPKIPKPE